MPEAYPSTRLAEIERSLLALENSAEFEFAQKIFDATRAHREQIWEIQSAADNGTPNNSPLITLKRIRKVLEADHEKIPLTGTEATQLAALDLLLKGIPEFGFEPVRASLESFDRLKGAPHTLLSQLVSKNLITTDEGDKKVYSLTEIGQRNAQRILSEKWAHLEALNEQID